FGASGRNGGWLSAELAGARDRYGDRDGVRALLRAMRDTVDEVIRVAADVGIDADVAKDGVLFVARNEAQLRRLRASVAEERAWGDDVELLDRAALADRVRVEGALAGS